MSRIVVDAIRNSSASSDGITLASDGSVTIPGNATCSGTASGFGGGKILQVVQTLKNDTTSITSSNTNSFVDVSGMSLSITPTATTSKILVYFTIALSGNAGSFHIRLVRGSTNIGIGDGTAIGNRLQSTFLYRPMGSPYEHACDAVSHCVLDTPNTTSATTYKLQGSAGATYSATWYFNRTYSDSNNDYEGRTVSSITALEVGA